MSVDRKGHDLGVLVYIRVCAVVRRLGAEGERSAEGVDGDALLGLLRAEFDWRKNVSEVKNKHEKI
jgi:hypothetical protein